MINGERHGRHENTGNGLLMTTVTKWACESEGHFKEVVEYKFINPKVLRGNFLRQIQIFVKENQLSLPKPKKSKKLGMI